MQKVVDLLAKFVKHGEKLSFFANLVITVVNGATKWLEENAPNQSIKK
ncbi:hypothetical protein HZP23_15525 [Elizabethkingia anophelis]|nr:hypothetical protein [Elizabethkingia anophelis]MCT4302250.1 hypothetical protein [Elizabethkingia anophelis]